MTDYYCNWCIVAILRFLAQSTSRHVVMSAMIYHQKMAPLFGEALCTYLYYGYHHILCSTLKVCKKKKNVQFQEVTQIWISSMIFERTMNADLRWNGKK